MTCFLQTAPTWSSPRSSCSSRPSSTSSCRRASSPPPAPRTSCWTRRRLTAPHRATRARICGGRGWLSPPARRRIWVRGGSDDVLLWELFSFLPPPSHPPPCPCSSEGGAGLLRALPGEPVVPAEPAGQRDGSEESGRPGLLGLHRLHRADADPHLCPAQTLHTVQGKPTSGSRRSVRPVGPSLWRLTV